MGTGEVVVVGRDAVAVVVTAAVGRLDPEVEAEAAVLVPVDLVPLASLVREGSRIDQHDAIVMWM